MKRGFQQTTVIIGILSLFGIIIPSFLFLWDRMSHDQVKWVMLVATLFWFISASIRVLKRG